MKTIGKRTVVVLTAALIAVILLASCQEGVTREERISMFKADISSGSNPREHFEGHSKAGSIDSNTFYNVDGWHPDYNITFEGGDFIGDSTFTIYYSSDTSGGSTSATGNFQKVSGSGASGDTWYIHDITIDTFNVPGDL